MAGAMKVGELVALLRLDKSQFERDAKASGGVFDGLAGVAKKAALAIGAALLGIGVASAGMAINFERNFANVHTLLGSGSEAERRIDQLKGDVKGMSVETGKSLDDLTGGLYQVISAFGDTKDSSEILRIAAKASTAGLATTTDAVNLLSAVTKGYGDTSAEAVQKASDLAFQTVKLGQTTFPELAASMGKAVPMAKALGISQEELFGATATLTGVTGGTSEVMTQLQGTMVALLKPNTNMQKALKELGFATGDAAIEALGYQGTLEALAGTQVASEVGMAKIMGRAEALTATLALTGSQSDVYREKLTAMGDAAGMTSEAFEIQQATVGATMDRVNAAIGVVLVTLGEKFLPLIQSVLDWFLANMPAIQATVEGAFAALGAAISWVADNVIPPLVGAFNSVVEFLVPVIDLVAAHAQPVIAAFALLIGLTLVPVVWSLVAGVIALAAPFIAVGAAVAVAVAWLDEVGLLGPMIDEAMALIQQGVQAAGEAFDWISANVIPPLVDAFNFLPPIVTDVLGAAFDFLTNTVLPALGAAFSWIGENVLPIIAGAFDFLANTVIPVLGDAFGWIANDILPPLVDAFNWIASIVVPILSAAFDFLTRTVIPALVGAFNFILDAVKFVAPFVQRLFQIMGDVIAAVTGAISKVFEAMVGAIRTGVDIVKGILDVLSRAFDAVGKFIGGVLDGISRVFDGVVGVIRGAVDSILGVFGGLWDGIQATGRQLMDFLGGLFKPLSDAINSAVGLAKDIWNGFVRFWNGFELRIPAIKVADFQITPELVFGLPKLPTLAAGGTAWADMTALVGERGPELVRLPAGARVESAARTRNLLGGGIGGAPLIGQQVINGIAPDEVETQTRRAIRRATLEMRFA